MTLDENQCVVKCYRHVFPRPVLVLQFEVTNTSNQVLESPRMAWKLLSQAYGFAEVRCPPSPSISPGETGNVFLVLKSCREYNNVGPDISPRLKYCLKNRFTGLFEYNWRGEIKFDIIEIRHDWFSD